ncbi:MAG: pirin family protein [Bdellovibrionales bacterium]
MIVRKSEDRGRGEFGWLKARYTFSFSEYHDPEHMGFGVLRVINEDRIAGGGGFPTHGHRDMEIITYVIEGALEHKDSMGNSTIIRPGEVQRMSAGTGVRHSEFNHFQDQTTHLLQIWILPDKVGHPPGYGQKSFAEELAKGGLVKVVTPDGQGDTIAAHQDFDLYALKSAQGGQTRFHPKKPSRSVWIQIVNGTVQANGQELSPGDAAAWVRGDELQLAWQPGAELLLFDLPPA